MGARLGMPSESFDPFKGKRMTEVHQLQSLNIFPTTPALSEENWKKIQNYFLTLAPDSFPEDAPPILENQQLFHASFPSISLTSFPAITMVKIDRDKQSLYLGDWHGSFVRLSSDFSVKDQVLLPMPIIDMERMDENNLRLLSIGQLYPNDKKLGALIELDERNYSAQKLIFDGLRRPVHLLTDDLNGDGIDDHVICSFGNMIGELIWLEKTGNAFVEHLIKQVPGAIRAYAEDLDGNGYKDLVVLFAQGDEGISIFYNEAGVFKEERALKFHPLFGCNDFQFVDFDADGNKDIILTHGDNGDHSNVLKPYHGLRIYLNDGQQQFSEKYFFPFHGASMVRCGDFDLDGDTDMALMSFFPDFANDGAQSLLYLENKGAWKFTAHQIPEAAEGRWMVMDANDLDGDGDIDLVFGSFLLDSEEIEPALLAKWKKGSKEVLVLENQAADRAALE